MAATTDSLDAWADRVRGRELGDDGTIEKYRRWIRRFEKWRPAGTPDEDMLRDFDSYLDDESMAGYPWENPRGVDPPASYSYQSRVIALSALKKHWLPHEYDATVDTKVQNLALGEPEPFDPTVIPWSEVNQTMNEAKTACDNEDCHHAIKLGYDAIMRGAELCRVRPEDIDLDQQTVFVRAVKNSNQITVGMDSNVWVSMDKCVPERREQERLFTNAYGRPWKPDAWSEHFRQKHHEAGWHAFARHSAITNRLADGEDFGDVYRRARHKHPAMTIRYARIVDAPVPEWAAST